MNGKDMTYVAYATPVNDRDASLNIPIAEINQSSYGEPSAPAMPNTVTNDVNEAGAREFLTSYRWPPGLQDTFIRNLKKIPMRFFICDDSGSVRFDLNNNHNNFQLVPVYIYR